MKRTEELHNQHKARERDARKAKEAVANVAESMHKTPSGCVCVFLFKQCPVSVLPIA